MLWDFISEISKSIVHYRAKVLLFKYDDLCIEMCDKGLNSFYLLFY